MKMCTVGTSLFTTIRSDQHAELVTDSTMLFVIKRMLASRLDKSGYARIDDICELFGMHYVEKEDDDDE